VRRPSLFWGASVGAIVAYTLSALGVLPWLPVFAPRLDAWSWTATPGEPTIRWYGFLIHGLIGSGVGALLARPLRRPPWHLVPVLAAAALLLLGIHDRAWFLR
jgi:hypothetical protein